MTRFNTNPEHLRKMAIEERGKIPVVVNGYLQHSINNALLVALGRIDLAMSCYDSASANQHLERAKDAIDRMRNDVGEILNIEPIKKQLEKLNAEHK